MPVVDARETRIDSTEQENAMGGKLLSTPKANRFWSDEPSRKLVSANQWTEISETLGLSEREFQVCQRLFIGHTREEVAEELEIKLRTVRQYAEQLHHKLRVNNRVGLVLRVIQIRDHLKHQRG